MVKLTHGAAQSLYELLAVISGAYQDTHMPDVTISERDVNVYVLDVHTNDEDLLDFLNEEGIEHAPYSTGVEIEFVSQLV